jgi:hypothetical protein
LFLAAGIWSIIASLLVASLSACCWITWALQLALAIVCIIHGARMLGDETVPPSKLAAWGLVAMLVNCDVVSFVLGIIVLTQMADHRLRAWYEARGIRA